MIPLGFNRTTSVVLDENVIGYHSYYSVSFDKDYTRNFDNITMFNYFYYQAEALKAQVTAFYGKTNEQNLYESDFTFSLNDTYFESSLELSNFIKYSFCYSIFLFILI